MKVALVYSFKESDWYSCTVIVRNLVKAYEKAIGAENITHMNYAHTSRFEVQDLRELSNEGFDKIIFVDHKPTPAAFLEGWEKLNKNFDNLPEVIVHVYGDFPLYLREWRTFNSLMINKQIKFICASERQKKYIQKYYGDHKNIFVSPFPVDSNDFSLNGQNEDIKSIHNIPEDSQILLYTGRLSYQKGIKELVEHFCRALEKKKLKDNTYLFIAGEFDEIGLPFLGYHQIKNEYARDVFRSLENYSDEIQKRVIFLGKIDNKDLVSYYTSVDYFVSFSTYHDEDYGMSVAEALCCGRPVVLSDWAGFASFKLEGLPQATEYVPVRLSKNKPILVEDKIDCIFEKLKFEDVENEKISQQALKQFSIDSVSEKLLNILNEKVQPFCGGTELMSQLISQQYIKSMELFRKEGSREFNHFYFKVYDAYVK